MTFSWLGRTGGFGLFGPFFLLVFWFVAVRGLLWRGSWHRGWRGGPELVVGLLLPFFAFAESGWTALFFVFAVSGLVSIGAMGAATAVMKHVRQQITPGE